MNTILTDDEIATAIAHLYAGPEVLAMALPDELHSARAVEAAVLAKLAQQEPVAWLARRPNGDSCAFEADDPDLELARTDPTAIFHPLYTHPAPQQADRQRVPEGYVLVPVEPTDEMVDAACDKSDFFRVDFVLAWDAAINASPELTQSATSHTHKVVPVTPTKEMLISGARAPVELLSPDGALQVYRAMLAAAPEAPAQAEFVHDPACKMCEGRGYYVAGYSGREDDGNAPIHEECDCWIPNPEAPAQEKSNG